MAKLKTVSIPTYSLELSQEELDTLYIIFQHIGGNISTTRRKYADSMAEVITSSCDTRATSCETVEGSIYFRKEI